MPHTMWLGEIPWADSSKKGHQDFHPDADLLAIVNDFSGLVDIPSPGTSLVHGGNTLARTPQSAPFPTLNVDLLDTVGDLVAQALDSPQTPQSAPIIQEGPFTLRIRQMRFEIFSILSDDLEFPEFHTRTIIDLASKISEGTPESELRDLWTLLLYFVETLGVLLDKERQWEESKDSYLAAATSKTKPPKFHIRAIRMLSGSNQAHPEISPETLEGARKAFERDYVRWKKRFIVLLKRYWAVSSTKFRVDFSNRPYARTVELCLNSVFSLWEEVHAEYQKIQLELSKLRGDALARKIARIEREFDFSDLEAELQRAADLEAARNGTYRPKPRTKR